MYYTWQSAHMPNQPRPDNPARTVRIADQLWSTALALAKRQQVTVSEMVRRSLQEYVDKHRGKP